jgi:hypothetical protein
VDVYRQTGIADKIVGKVTALQTSIPEPSIE